jgi:molybdopterin synthase catalytic subunit
VLGKVVTKLEYQAYSKLAIKTMAKSISDACTLSGRSEHQPEGDAAVNSALIKCAVYHRLGTVPVREPSIGENRQSGMPELCQC